MDDSSTVILYILFYTDLAFINDIYRVFMIICHRRVIKNIFLDGKTKHHSFNYMKQEKTITCTIHDMQWGLLGKPEHNS